MVRRCATVDSRRNHVNGNGNGNESGVKGGCYGDSHGDRLDHGSFYGHLADIEGTTRGVATADGAGSAQLFPRRTRPVGTGARSGDNSSSAIEDELVRHRGSGFVVGRSSERLTAAESMRRGGSREEDKAPGALRADVVAAAAAAAVLVGRNAAGLPTVEGHDEWKEACTAEGKM